MTIDVLEELGSDSHVFFRVAAPRVTIESRNSSDDETILAESDSRFTARVNPATKGNVGGSLELVVDPSGFHFFDARSGESLLAPAGSLADAGRQAAHEEALPG